MRSRRIPGAGETAPSFPPVSPQGAGETTSPFPPVSPQADKPTFCEVFRIAASAHTEVASCLHPCSYPGTLSAAEYGGRFPRFPPRMLSMQQGDDRLPIVHPRLYRDFAHLRQLSRTIREHSISDDMWRMHAVARCSGVYRRGCFCRCTPPGPNPLAPPCQLDWIMDGWICARLYELF